MPLFSQLRDPGRTEAARWVTDLQAQEQSAAQNQRRIFKE
jgi:hypothetical protein